MEVYYTDIQLKRIGRLVEYLKLKKRSDTEGKELTGDKGEWGRGCGDGVLIKTEEVWK